MTWQTNAWRPRTARVERLESNAMSEWCFQCGVAQKPERAIGWDEDGEPACALHSVKAKKPFNLEQSHGRVAEQVAEKSSANSFAKKFEAAQIKPAAPSPVQIKQEKVMEDKFCIVEGCGKKLRSDNNSGYCKPHRNEVKKVGGVRKSSKRLYEKALDDLTDAIVGSGPTESVFGANRFTAGQLDRFWSLLSPASKAEAVDRLLSYTAF